MDSNEMVNDIDGDAATRRSVFKMAAGVAVGATTLGMLSSRASAGRSGPAEPTGSLPMATFPITPVRVYDSRWTSTVSGIPEAKLGRMTPNSSRVIDCAFARSSSGVLIDPNTYAIASSATAIYFNITVTNCNKANYLCIAPGNQTTQPATSIINFDTGSTIANSSFVSLYTNLLAPAAPYQSVKLFCGEDAGSCHVILDIVGYATAWFVV